jgi:hypothetical protein
MFNDLQWRFDVFLFYFGSTYTVALLVRRSEETPLSTLRLKLEHVKNVFCSADREAVIPFP